MASVKDSLSLHRLTGIPCAKEFQVVDMGYYSWSEHFGHHAFFQQAAFKDLPQGYKDSELCKT